MRPLMSSIARVLPGLAVLLALGACDAAAPFDGALQPSTFTLRVGDGVEEQRDEAHFGTYVSAESGNTFAMVLGTPPLSNGLTAPAVGFAYDGVAVSPGTYSLAAVNPGGAPPKEAFIGVYIDPAQTGGTGGRTGFYYTGDGTLTLDSLDAEHAWGSSSMRGLELDALAAPTGAEVQITGTFHAVHTDAFGDEEAFWW